MYVLEAGQQFERYRILRQLGNGIAGTSYEAEEVRLQRKVTLKLVHPWSVLPDASRRQFFRDMQSLSVIKHPSLVPILNYGEAAGQLYVARGYLHDGSLLGSKGRIKLRPPLDIKDAFTYTSQLAEVLYYIHEHDYTHGSLTLANILLHEQPSAEPGLVSLFLSDTRLAQFVRRFGQPQQQVLPITAAPEQFNGQVVPASDQYALAVLLYLWLTGRPPFLGTPSEIEALKAREIIPQLHVPHLTLEQEYVLRRALSANHKDRFPSVHAFAEALMLSLVTPREQGISTEVLSQQTPNRPPTEPTPEPIPQTQPEPEQEPAPPDPQLPTEPVVIPTPEPDITQPVPDQTPFSPAPIPVEPRPEQMPESAQNEVDSSTSSTEAAKQLEADAVPAAHLTITSPFSSSPRQIDLLREETTLGRAGSSDILLDQDTITSRHHALIKRDGRHFVIYDQRSMYGVTINDYKIQSETAYQLKDGDRIQIGDYTLFFALGSSQDVQEVATENIIS